MIPLGRAAMALVVVAPLLASCGSTAAPEEAVLTMACRPTELNTARFPIAGTDDEHTPQQTVCTVTPINVEPGEDLFVKVDESAADEAALLAGDEIGVARAGWARMGGCEGLTPDEQLGEELALPGVVGPPVINDTLTEDKPSLSFCFQCGEGERGVTAVSAELLSDPNVKAPAVEIDCITRNPVNFRCEVRAESPQVGLGRPVKLTVNAYDDDEGRNVANEFIKVSTDQRGALTGGEGEETEVNYVLLPDAENGLAKPGSNVTFTCPSEPDLYQVSVEFADQQKNGDTRCTTFVNCTDDKKANFINVTSSEERLVADCASQTTITALVTGPEGPVTGRDPEAPVKVTLCANAEAVWQVEDAEDTLKCHECCASCDQVFGSGDECSRVTLEVDDNGVASADIRAGGFPSTLTVAAESNLSDLPYVQRNPEQFEDRRLVVDGEVSVTQVGIGDIPFIQASPRILGVRGSGFNESASVCFQINDTVGKEFPAGIEVEFDIPNSAGEATVSPSIVETDSAGRACTTLLGGKVATTVSVRAKVRLGACPDVDAIEVQSVSPGIPIIGVKPSAGGFALDCEMRNVGALTETDGLNSLVSYEFPCDTQLKDRFGNPVGLSTAVSYRAEAGVIGGTVNTVPLDTGADPTSAQPNVGKARVYYGTFGVLPKDVVPFNLGQFQGTPREPRVGNDPERNPRDGLVTIIAYVSGEEQFTDTDGSGDFTPGEPFVDLPEPFLDYDDDNLHDEDEPFIDINLSGNLQGEHDGPNGQWDDNTIIWTETRIVWSGGPRQVRPSIDRACTQNVQGCGFANHQFNVSAEQQSCGIVAGLTDANLNLTNCTTQYQWVSQGAGLIDPDLGNVHCINMGIQWGLTLVPAGAAQPNVLRRRSQITGWGSHVGTRVGGNANAPVPLLPEEERSGYYFDGTLTAASPVPEAGADPLPWLKATVKLNVTWSAGPGANRNWSYSLPFTGCVQ